MHCNLTILARYVTNVYYAAINLYLIRYLARVITNIYYDFNNIYYDFNNIYYAVPNIYYYVPDIYSINRIGGEPLSN